MTDVRYITDEELVAYLDDELSAEDALRVTDALSHDSLLNERLRAFDVPIERLRSGADTMLASAPSFPDHLVAEKPTNWLQMAGMVAVLGIGFGFGASVWPRADADWIETVANYQSLYVTQTLDRAQPVEARENILTALSETIGLDLLPLLDIAQLDYRRGQALAFEGRPLIQLAYLDNQIPIAICITFVDGPDRPITEGAHFGLSTVSWQKDGRGFLVIGGDDTSLLRQVTEVVQDRT